MTLTLDLSPEAEARLALRASITGHPIAEIAQKILEEASLDAYTSNQKTDAKTVAWVDPRDIDQILAERHKQDQITLMPSRTAADLFADTDRVAAAMSDEEREAEDRFWEEFEKGINATRAVLGMRQL